MLFQTQLLYNQNLAGLDTLVASNRQCKFRLSYFSIYFLTRAHYIAQTGLELVVTLSSGLTVVYHHTQLVFLIKMDPNNRDNIEPWNPIKGR